MSETFELSLAELREVRPRASFRAGLRAQLLAAPVVVPARPRAIGLRQLLSAALAIALLLAGGGAAAGASLPGDVAYPLRLALEDARLALTFNDAARIDLAVAIAERRLAEIEVTLASRPSAAAQAAAAYASAMSRVRSLVQDVRDDGPASPVLERAVERATEEQQRHIDVLEDVRERAPEPAREAIDRAISPVPTRVPTPSGPTRPSAAPSAPGRGGPPVTAPSRR